MKRHRGCSNIHLFPARTISDYPSAASKPATFHDARPDSGSWMSRQLTSVTSDLPLACRRVSPDTVLGSSFCLQEVKRIVRRPAPTCTSCQVRSRRRPASIPAEIGLGAKRPISPIAPPWSSGRCEQLPRRIGCRLEVGGETTGGRPPQPTHRVWSGSSLRRQRYATKRPSAFPVESPSRR